MPPLRIVVLAVVIALTAAGACTRSSGDKDTFCAALPGTDDVFALIDDLDTTDSARLQQRFEAGLAEFRKLERAAPRDIRSDVGTVVDAVEQILEAVQQHPDDMGAVREELARNSASLLSSGRAALAVRDYASEECGIELEGGTDPITPTTSPTSSEPGGPATTAPTTPTTN